MRCSCRQMGRLVVVAGAVVVLLAVTAVGMGVSRAELLNELANAQAWCILTPDGGLMGSLPCQGGRIWPVSWSTATATVWGAGEMRHNLSARGVLLLVLMAALVSCAHAGTSSAAATPGVPPDLAPCVASRAGKPILGGLPDRTLDCLGHGPAVPMTAIRGPAVINLWASWCAPCQREMPSLQRAHRQQGARIRFIGVDTKDLPGSALGFLRAEHVTYEQLSDPQGTLAAALAAPGLPMTVAIDASGRVVWRKAGQLHAGDLPAAVRAATGGGA
jgi:cytochrome c biogenesis protein CcmG, thiol:disulfide interchange protein DsbE